MPATVIAAEGGGLVVDWFDPPELQELYRQARTKGWTQEGPVDRWGYVSYADTSFLSEGLAVRWLSALEGAVVARPTLPIVLGADHRIIDGDLAEAFREAGDTDARERTLRQIVERYPDSSEAEMARMVLAGDEPAPE